MGGTSGNRGTSLASSRLIYPLIGQKIRETLVLSGRIVTGPADFAGDREPGLLGRFSDSKTRRGDMFTSARRASAGSGQAFAFSEQESTVQALGCRDHKPAVRNPADGARDVGQMIFDLTLRNGEKMGKIPGRLQFPHEMRCQLLPKRSRRRHELNSLQCDERVLEFRCLGGQIFLFPNQALQNREVFATGINGKVRGQDVLFEIQHDEGLLFETSPDENLIMLALVPGKLQVQVEDVGPHIR